jgi:hypothetical protein
MMIIMKQELTYQELEKEKAQMRQEEGKRGTSW